MANPQQPPPLPVLPPNYVRAFDPQALLPTRLQKRIDNWRLAPPDSQFQTYGPLAGYFHEKFPPTFFLIKPQAYLSAVFNQGPGGHRRIDSHGMEVDGSRKYPDFTICQFFARGSRLVRPAPPWFFGADADGTSPDVIRVVYEIGTTSTTLEKDKVARQLRSYLETVTRDRFDTNLLGVAQIGGMC
ncbi:hypothetical protein B0H12DRAFT_1230833 [Mycena haematopus]|nr:hypothetical protein B0H12DRAFT_1230833 [Mycena haematopus]